MHYTIGEQIATRTAFGDALVKFGGRNKKVVVFDADLSGSMRTKKFSKLYPDRHFNFGVAESNMVNTAAGMASRGKIPFACSFAVFVTGRPWEHIRNSICYPNLNVKLVGSHAGILTGEDGATHQALEDIAIMRSLPNMKVISPADAVETYSMVNELLKDFGPVYVRLGRGKVPVIYGQDHTFRIGYGDMLTYGEDVCLVSTGATLHSCLEAAKKLENEGLRVMVINMSTIKPIDRKLIVDGASKTSMMVTVEDHTIIGGLGSAVAEVLTEKYPTKLYRIGMDDCFGESGKPEDLYKKYGLDAQGVYERVLTLWENRSD